jgi:serum/glucocorticoid-regulated kinase 2
VLRCFFTVRSGLRHNSDVTVQEEVAVYAYLRREEPKSADGMQDSMGANDICLGVAKFVPNLDQMGSEDDWYEFSNGTGRIQVRSP